jgi:ribonuclease HI
MSYSLETVLLQLEHLGTPFAVITARWLRAEDAAGRGAVALTDPTIQDIIYEAQMKTACGWKPPSGILTIYCDGSCTSNGKPEARAGFGVYVTRDGVEAYRHSERIGAGEPQTNQRAELRGLQHALTYLLGSGTATGIIYTDSKYALDCLRTWGPGWEKKGWKKADGKDVLHQDLLKPMMETLRMLGGRVELKHVFGHTGALDAVSAGNAIADELACAATAR